MPHPISWEAGAKRVPPFGIIPSKGTASLAAIKGEAAEERVPFPHCLGLDKAQVTCAHSPYVCLQGAWEMQQKSWNPGVHSRLYVLVSQLSPHGRRHGITQCST